MVVSVETVEEKGGMQRKKSVVHCPSTEGRTPFDPITRLHRESERSISALEGEKIKVTHDDLVPGRKGGAWVVKMIGISF